MRLVFVASDPREYTGILAHAAQARRAPLAVEWARTAQLGAHEAVLVANGAGRRRAAAALEAAAAGFPADAVVSTGFCGALEEHLQIADVVVGTCVADAGRRYPASPVHGPGAVHPGLVYTADRVAQTASEKRSLRSTGACAVEMEAAGVAERAQVLGLQFYCVRAVTDLAGEDLANDFNAALRPDGHFDTIVILKGTLSHPKVRLRELFRLRRRCVQASRVLGDFFADCRF